MRIATSGLDVSVKYGFVGRAAMIAVASGFKVVFIRPDNISLEGGRV